jgi:hypothetical protein
MRRLSLAAVVGLISFSSAHAYIEAPHSLGQVVHESTNIVYVELVKVNTEKNLLIYRKLADLKGKHEGDEIKHNIGKRGFHEREWKTIMNLAQPGERAVFFYNGQGSETCQGTYWYQCYNEGAWWALSHGEPFLLRTFYGDVDSMAEAVKKIIKGEEVVVTCLADANKNDLHLCKGKVQRLKASSKRLEYNAKRDFVGWGSDGSIVEQFKTVELLPASSSGWTFIPAAMAAKIGDRWINPAFNDSDWRKGKAPIGYGEDELTKRQGTIVAEQGQAFLFRRVIDVSDEVLRQAGAKFQLNIASDDCAVAYLNNVLVDKEDADHEFAYWNREIELPRKFLKPGRNVLAIRVLNKPGSSDLYLDAELTVSYPLAPKKPPVATLAKPNGTTPRAPAPAPADDPRDPKALTVDKKARTISIACAIALRKLPNLDQRYPIEVVATYPAPRGLKAHETIVSFKGVKPSDIHKALEELGLKPGKPAYGENGEAEGPEVRVFIEWTLDGKTQRLPIEECLVHRDSGKPMTALKFRFTGSVMKQPDPEKDDKVYGADMSGTLLSLFPVTNETVLQSQLTLKDEPSFKLETSPKLPKEGTAAKLMLVIP